ncbi:hypothetical protein BHM03_00044164 [Ensete ventricosum]|nr:hypothetical protein BHM03_00044164 [Ensete ventricosum]
MLTTLISFLHGWLVGSNCYNKHISSRCNYGLARWLYCKKGICGLKQHLVHFWILSLTSIGCSMAGPSVLASGIGLLYVSAGLSVWSLVVYTRKIWTSITQVGIVTG